MFRISWTGWGFLSALFLPIFLFAGIIAGTAVSSHGRIVALFAAAGVAVAAAVNQAVAVAINSTRTPDGQRVWGRRHTLNGWVMQRYYLAYLTFAFAVLGGAVGALTNGLFGALAFLVPLVALAGGPTWVRSRRKKATNAERAAYATAHQLLFRPELPALGRRWRPVLGVPATYIKPFGLLGGTVDGAPFTAFDHYPVNLNRPRYRTISDRETLCMVHLPAAYPALEVRFGPDGTPQVTCERPDFARDLLAPQVIEASRRAGLPLWRIWGRDLVVTIDNSAGTLPPDQLPATARALAAVAAQFPPEAARHGTAPSPDSQAPLVAVAEATPPVRSA